MGNLITQETNYWLAIYGPCAQYLLFILLPKQDSVEVT